MLHSLKQTKRRTVQRVLVNAGRAEQTLFDAEYDDAERNFFALERELHAVLARLKELRKVLERFAATNAALTSHLSLVFADENGEGNLQAPVSASAVDQIHEQEQQQKEGDQKEQDENEDENQEEEIQHRPHDALEVAACYSKLQTEVQGSCIAVLQKAIDELETFLDNQFPTRKREIAEHAGLRTDVESYRRRVKALQERGKEGNHPSLMKVTAKLENATHTYRNQHSALLQNLQQFYRSRKKILEPIYAAFFAAQIEFNAFLATRLSDILANSSAKDQVEDARSEIQELIIGGGVKPPKPKARERLFSRLQRRPSKKRESMLSQPNHSSMAMHSVPGGDESVPPLDPHTSRNDELASHTSSMNASIGQSEGQSLGLPTPNAPLSETPNSVGSPTSVGGFETNGKSDLPPDTICLCIGTFKFEGTGDPTDLTFKKNDVIQVTQKIDDGWWRGRLDGKEGLFPTTYVREI